MSSMKNDEDYRSQIRLKAKNDFQKDLTEEQIDMCIYTEEQEKLSFFHGHLYINARNMQIDGSWVTKVQWSRTIDGYRVLAQRNGLCQIDEPEWQHDSNGNVVRCKVTVWRRGPDGRPEGPFVGIAHYPEFVQLTDVYTGSGRSRKKTGEKKPNSKWESSPMNQLSVCAERQAHRKAGLDHTKLAEDIVDIRSAATVDEPTEDVAITPEPEVEAAPAPTLGWKEAHRGREYRGAMIVVTVASPSNCIILLDNGEYAAFKRDGDTPMVEVEVGQRSYEHPGGAEWLEGSSYYDGAKVVGVTTKGRVAVLELDSGFKVKLDQWGKENGRKELKKEASEPESKEEELAKPEEPPKIAEGLAEAMALAEDSSGASVETLRKGMIRLLAYWCQTVNGGVKISPKSAYIELVGVAIGDGDRMQESDFRALLETLHEKIQEKAA